MRRKFAKIMNMKWN